MNEETKVVHVEDVTPKGKAWLAAMERVDSTTASAISEAIDAYVREDEGGTAMTNPEETPAEIIARYEAGAVRVPTPEGSAGELWWQLLNSPVEDRLGTLRRCIEPGWVSPNGVAYLASVLELPAGAGWDDVTAAVRALKAASEPDPEPDPDEPGEPAREARDGQR